MNSDIHAHDPSDGPFNSRSEAEAAFTDFRRAAERGRTGPPGEEITYTLSQFLADSITDAIADTTGVEVGRYDQALIVHLAGYLDAVEAAVLMSWIRRAAGAVPEAGQ
jgi:hypothetical protein